MKWSFDDCFDRCFLYPDEVEKQNYNISKLRSLDLISIEDRLVFQQIIKMGQKRHYQFLQKKKNKPRIEAQKFLSKKNIRKFIFERDNYSCLRCGSKKKLSLDHIQPVNKKGKNTISNLQTLCTSCNSKKSDNYKDYR